VTIENQRVGGEEAAELSSRIAANARKLDRMVTDLLDMDRLSRGIVEPNLETTDVGELVSRVVDEAEVASGRDVTIDVAHAFADVDVAKLERIIENLLVNAVRHTPPDSSIWVSVRREDDGVEIVVEDDGPGVPPDLREEIFQPFRQGAPSDDTSSTGVGIGLALVARFAELHRGHAWVQEREGGGASFRVWLPARETADAVTTA
jgi:signal transduction histidine kinase